MEVLRTVSINVIKNAKYLFQNTNEMNKIIISIKKADYARTKS